MLGKDGRWEKCSKLAGEGRGGGGLLDFMVIKAQETGSSLQVGGFLKLKSLHRALHSTLLKTKN